MSNFYTFQLSEDRFYATLISPFGKEQLLMGEDKSYFVEDAENLLQKEYPDNNYPSKEAAISDLIETYYWES